MMTDLVPLFPRQKTPSLAVQTVDGETFNLHERMPDKFTMIVFYRGVHCPVCKIQLRDLRDKLDEFSQRGVDVIAISADTEDRARRAKSEWNVGNVRIGYGLELSVAREWGLFVSSARKGSDEPALFTEPAIYLIQPDATLYFGSVQTMPFARPHFADIIKGIDFVLSKDYPARGEVLTVEGAAV